MPNINSDAPAAHSLGSGCGPSPAAYHPRIQTAHHYGGDFFGEACAVACLMHQSPVLNLRGHSIVP
jgi:hypothetical protein